MNILHILPRESFGGVPNYVRGLLKGLKKLGCTNICVSFNSNFDVYDRYCHVMIRKGFNGFFVKATPDTIKVYLHSLFKINLDILKDSYNVDAIILNNDPRTIRLENVVRTKVPIIRVQHGTYMNYLYWYSHLPIPFIDRIKELSHVMLYHYDVLHYIRKATKQYSNFYVVAVSERTKKELIHQGVSPSKVYVITAGVDKDIYKPLTKEYARKTLRHTLDINIDEDDEVLLHVGPRPRKGTHILLKAFKKMSNLRKVKVIIVGSFKGAYGKALLDFMRRNAFYKNVLLVDRAPEDHMVLLYNAADIVVQPSYSEGCPLTLLESLACGTPIITTNVGCNDDYLKTMALCDLLIRISEPDFSDDLSGKIMYALENKEYFRRKVLSNRDKVPSWIDIAKQYANLVDYLK